MQFRGLAVARVALGAAALIASSALVTDAAWAQDPPAGAADEMVSRGAYLARIGLCYECHTREGGADLAGGRAIASPFGDIYSANITPDPEHGIGSWSQDDFTRALRQGLLPGGNHLYPAMPYVSFTKMADEDVAALWAFLRTVDPVAYAPPTTELAFPFNIRTGIAAWNALYFKDGRYVHDASQSDEWNRGAYVVDAVAHCGACHTPRNLLMGREEDRHLQGAVIDYWYAPDISGDDYSAIADWTVEDIASYLRTGHNPDNVAAVGSMFEAVEGGLDRLTDADAQAIAVYLKAQTSEPPETVGTTLTMSTTQMEAAGTLYEVNCQGCHEADGEGVAGLAPTLVGTSSVDGREPDTVIHAVLEGFLPRDDWGPMPSFAHALSNQQIAEIANYVRTKWGDGLRAAATASLVAQIRAHDHIAEGDAQAIVCPGVPSAQMTPEIRGEVADLAGQEPTAEALTPVVSAYHQQFPDVGKGVAVQRLTGVYCQALLDQGRRSYDDVLGAFVAFMGRVAAAAEEVFGDDATSRG